LEELLDQNVRTSLLCSQAALPMLVQSRGSIVNIGSLASKVGARYLGGYSAAKHALAGLTGQLRLESAASGVHVGLVCPGPIRRSDAGERYRESSKVLPEQAAQPGGGARLRGLDPDHVARAVVKCVQKRSPEIILPGYLRLLIAIGNASPRLGDWLIVRFTSSKPS
ncbi:MAG: SDR family NAD(P)-dependent oxidoreductase, partial [Planctomycetota bacterium]